MASHCQHCFWKASSLKTLTEVGIASSLDYSVGPHRVSGIVTESHCHLNVIWNEPTWTAASAKAAVRTVGTITAGTSLLQALATMNARFPGHL